MSEWGGGAEEWPWRRGSGAWVAVGGGGCGGFVCVLGVVMFPWGVRREGG